MGRVIRYWIVLGTVAAVTTYGGVFLVFGHIDLSFLPFAAIVCAPLLQAVVLAWRETSPADIVRSMTRTVAARPLAQPVLVLDALMLGGGIAWWYSHVIGLGAEVNVQSTWTLVKAIAASAFILRAAWQVGGRKRAAVIGHMTAPILLMLALEPSWSWLVDAFQPVHAMAGDQGEVLQRLVFYGCAIMALVGVTLRSSQRLSTDHPHVGWLLQAEVGAAIGVTVPVVLATFGLPVLVQPWLGLATLAASLAATSVLLAAVLLLDTEA